MSADHLLIEPGTEPVVDVILGWPVTVSARFAPNWVTTVELTCTDPQSDETESVIDLTAEDAIKLAVQLIAVAHKVREGQRDRAVEESSGCEALGGPGDLSVTDLREYLAGRHPERDSATGQEPL